eukprot:204486_1
MDTNDDVNIQNEEKYQHQSIEMSIATHLFHMHSTSPNLQSTDATLSESQIKITGLKYFTPWHHLDYTNCQHNIHTIEKCTIMNRILHILAYYQNMMGTLSPIKGIYEYKQTELKNYDIAMLMEDWYQLKNSHLKADNNYAFIMKIKHMHCNNVKQCKYTQRYYRDREKEIYLEHKTMDLKDLIVAD